MKKMLCLLTACLYSISAFAYPMGGGSGFKSKGEAKDTTVSTVHFSKNLSSTDTDVQHALETLDQLSSGGTPGGSNTQVQYNNSTAFGGITGATSDGTNLSVTTQSASDNSTKAASTGYVTTAITNAIAAVNPAVAVQAASAAKLPNSPTYNNGTSGIGAFITTLTLNATLVVDGYTPALNDRILVKNEGDSGGLGAAKNGVYYVSQVASVGLAWILTRALDYDMPSDMNNTGAIPVVNGTANATTSWVQTSQVATVGTDAVTYAQFSYAPSTLITTSTSAGGDLTGTYPNPTIKSSVGLSGSPTTTTQSAGDNSTKIATTAYVDNAHTKYAYTTVSDAAYAVLTTDQVIAYITLTAARTITLPTAASVTGKWYIIKDETGKASYINITIATTSSQTIDDKTTLVINNAYQAVKVYSNGSNWMTI